MSSTLTHAVGRRKTAIASVRLQKADKNSLVVNGKTPLEYFKTQDRTRTAEEAFSLETTGTYAAIAHVEGGGISAQAEAVRHAISRAIVETEPAARKTFKTAGFLTRNARVKERKKPGKVKARKSKQWSKR